MMAKGVLNLYFFLKKVASQFPAVRVRRSHRFGTKLSVVLQTQTGYAVKGVKDVDPGPMSCLERLLSPGAVFYDVGANIGLYSVPAGALVGPEGAVVALEPDVTNCVQLMKNFHLNGTNATLIQAAVSGEAGMGSFVVDSLTSATGHLTSAEYTNTIASEWSSVPAPSRQVHVRKVRLDDLVYGAGFPFPTLVKIDVERHELSVMQGMSRILREVGPHLLVEVASENKQAFDGMLKAAGYRVVESFPGDNHLVGPTAAAPPDG